MSKLLLKLVHNVPLKGCEYKVMEKLVFYAYDDGTNCYPAVTTLARETHYSERTVRYALRKLEMAGYITTEVKGHMNPNHQQTNQYRINIEKLGWGNICPTSGAITAPGVGQKSTNSGAIIAPNHRGPKSLPNADSDFSRPSFEIITEAEADRRFEEERKSRP